MIYTVVINSEEAENTFATLNSANYFIDWSFLPQQKKYKVSFSFTTMKGEFDNDNISQIYIDFTASPNTYEISSSANTWRKTTNFLGLVHPVVNSGSLDSRLCASIIDNPPIYINGRPSNNKFSVKFYDMTKVLYDPVVNYILTLSFEEMD